MAQQQQSGSPRPFTDPGRWVLMVSLASAPEYLAMSERDAAMIPKYLISAIRGQFAGQAIVVVAVGSELERGTLETYQRTLFPKTRGTFSPPDLVEPTVGNHVIVVENGSTEVRYFRVSRPRPPTRPHA